jgi:hypothetical protein
MKWGATLTYLEYQITSLTQVISLLKPIIIKIYVLFNLVMINERKKPCQIVIVFNSYGFFV